MADALVLPGGFYGPGAPLPMYAGDAAELRGATVHRYEWVGRWPHWPTADDPEVEGWVRDQAEARVAAIGGTPLLIAKSLGTNAAGLAADRSLPAVWLTPLLNLPWVVAALERATAPFLLVGGTADRVWDGAVARRVTPHVLEVPDANHGMYVPGPLTASVAVLGQVVQAVQAFLDDIAWP